MVTGAALAASLPVSPVQAEPLEAEAQAARPSNTPPKRKRKPKPRPTTIRVDARAFKGPVRSGLLGINHRFVNDGHGLWDVETDSPDPVAVGRIQRTGVEHVRFPGGIVANLYDWKQAIGPDEERGCQTNGQWRPEGYGAVRGLAYGPDEHMEFVQSAGVKALMMVPYATETPGDAADWVEYMNSPADGPGGSNPREGTDWAEVRAANGHPAPYGIKLWEVGNEQRVKKQRYWMSRQNREALDQYANGGDAWIEDEALGRDCRHPVGGVGSNGSLGQVFQMLYPPVAEESVSVTVDGERWQLVEDASTTGPGVKAFELDADEGEIRFGDGDSGAVPRRGAVVRASYRSVHAGVFRFIRAMKRVDPSIRVCPTWGLKAFIQAAGRRAYDCFSAHSYTHFKAEGHRNWRSPLEGHDWSMLSTGTERAFVTAIRAALPVGIPIALTEFGAIWGNSQVYPHWDASMTKATYMASMWVHWLDLGIPWATGSDMIAYNYRGMLGESPDFTYSAEALVREAILPIFKAGGRRVRATISRNPQRRTGVGRRTYPGLLVAASRARNRDLYVLVVNRLPHNRSSVRTRLDLGRFTSRRVAYVGRVTGSSFRSWNEAGRRPGVVLQRSRRRIGAAGFTHVFPAHSVTVLRIPSR